MKKKTLKIGAYNTKEGPQSVVPKLTKTQNNNDKLGVGNQKIFKQSQDTPTYTIENQTLPGSKKHKDVRYGLYWRSCWLA